MERSPQIQRNSGKAWIVSIMAKILEAIALLPKTYSSKTNMLKRYFLILLAAVSCWGCQAKSTPPEIELAEITQAQLDDLLFPVDYGLLINQSLDGNQSSLGKLMALGKQVDGGGAYGFGVMLQTIALEIGDDKFAEAVEKLSAQEIQRTYQLLLAGFDYGDHRYTVDDFETVLPKTYAVMNQS